MPELLPQLVMERCPHCSVANPQLNAQSTFETKDHSNRIARWWRVYVCATCGGVVTAWSLQQNKNVVQIFPTNQTVNEDIPGKANTFLQQAIASIHAPAGAVMLAASSVDSMLKEKGYVEGSLYTRIQNAVNDNLITPEMASWAHEVRLDANDQRHSDTEAELPTPEDAQRVIDFAKAFGEYLFVLPAKITRGLSGS